MYVVTLVTRYTGQSQNAGKQMIEAILALQDSANTYRAEIDDLEEKLCNVELDVGTESINELNDRLLRAREKFTQFTTTIEQRKATLGIREQQNLRRLIGNKFLKLRVNALALKLRLRTRLRERRFEIERFEDLNKNSANGM